MRYDRHSHPSSSHQLIARLVRRRGRGPILDVGAAQGTLGELLAEGRGPTGPVRDLPIDGIEPNPAWAAEAAPWYRTVWAARVEDAPLPEGEYATVVCADVLEHLADPVATLTALRRAARPDATFVISVPNVAHLSARLLLLAGKWPRMERGIFDRTHLQFWTRETFEAMLAEAGLSTVLLRVTPVPLEQVWPEGRAETVLSAAMWTQRLLLRLLPRLFAFQWVVVATPTEDRAEAAGAMAPAALGPRD